MSPLLRYRIVLLAAACIAGGCGQVQPGDARAEADKRDSARIMAALDLAYDVQMTSPDSAFALMQGPAAEAKRRKLYGPLFNYYRYAVTNRTICAGDTATGRTLAVEASRLAQQTGDSLHLGDAAFCMGIIYGYMEITDSASFYFRRCAEYLGNGRDRSARLDAWHNLAEMMRIQGDYVNAEKYLLATLEATRGYNETLAQAIEYSSLYEVEYALGRKELAKAYLDSSAIFFARAGVPAEPTLLRMKGHNALAQGRADSALHYYDASLFAFLTTSDSLNAAISALAKGRAFSALHQEDSAAACVSLTEQLTTPERLPLTSRKTYYAQKLAILQAPHNSAERSRVSTEYICLLETFLEKNSKLIGTEYMHGLEQASKDRTILQQQLRATEKDGMLRLMWLGIAALAGLCAFIYLYWRKQRALSNERMKRLEGQRGAELLITRMNTQMEERSRIAHELHDDLGATLTSIAMATEFLQRKEALAGSREVRIIGAASSGLVDKMNEIVWSLNGGNDTVQSLAAYIRKFAGEFLEEAGIGLEAHLPEHIAEEPLPGYIRRALYLTVKEALHNVVKHAGATLVVLRLVMDEAGITIDISDNGRGIAQPCSSILGNGLKNMQTNMLAIGGTVSWHCDGGTHIHITSPLRT